MGRVNARRTCGASRFEEHAGVFGTNQVERHFKYTGSEQAKTILRDWDTARKRFIKVFPTEYKRALGELWVKAQGNNQQVTTV